MAWKPGRRAVILMALGVMVAGGLAGAVVRDPPQGPRIAEERPAQPVRVSPIIFAPATRTLTYTGTLRPRHELAAAFRIAGKITTRPVETGDRVVKGQLLAQLDDTDARLQVELAAAEDQAARTDQARALADVTRSRQLFAQGHLAQAALDRAVSAQAEAAARALRAERALTLARNALSYTRLVAEADGVVTATAAEAGQVVAAGAPIVRVAQIGAADVVFALPETERALLAQGGAQGRIWGEAGGPHRLILRDISPDADPVGRTYRVRMALSDPGGATFGQTVTVTVTGAGTVGAGGPVAVVPLAAVLADGAGPGVWRLRGEGVDRVAVELVAATGDLATIRGALAEGDRIISLGAHKIDPARPVRVVETHLVAGN